MNSWLRVLRDEKGVSAIEYCVLAAIIAVSLVGALQMIGGNVSAPMSKAGEAMSEAEAGGGGSGSDGDGDGYSDGGSGDSEED
jgi:pilus assembly protein Flp/PilA